MRKQKMIMNVLFQKDRARDVIFLKQSQMMHFHFLYEICRCCNENHPVHNYSFSTSKFCTQLLINCRVYTPVLLQYFEISSC